MLQRNRLLNREGSFLKYVSNAAVEIQYQPIAVESVEGASSD
jgi:hypothetical protein